MNYELFAAIKLIRDRAGKSGKGKKAVRPIINIAIAGIAISMVVMILSVAIVQGFQTEIQNKVIGFGGHIQITSLQSSDSYDMYPLSTDQDFYPELDTLPEVRNIQVFSNKAGILKNGEEILGIVMKGVGTDFDWSFFAQNLEEGHVLHFSDSTKNDSIIISRSIADKMKLGINDKFTVFFIQNNRPRPRRFTVAGIYRTNLENFDDLFIIGDIRHIQRINGWEPDQVSGFEVNLYRFDDLEKIDELIYQNVPFEIKNVSIKRKYSDIFGWLELQDMNVIIIISLMVLLSGVNMSSALLILILDRTAMIGILKSMGATNWSIRKLFLYISAYLITIGLFWGNLIGIGLAFLQKNYRFVLLNEDTYYIPYVPIDIGWAEIIYLNLFTLLLCMAILLLPSYIITRLKVVETLKFE